MPSKRTAPAAIWREAPDLDSIHDPGVARVASGLRETVVKPIRTADGRVVRIGTASWTDPTMTAAGVFYPKNATSPEARLRYYATRLPLVEVDSTYYALPSRSVAQLWADRTPDDFVFNVKAHALMTGQPSEVSRLPRAIQDALPATLATRLKVYGKDLPPDIVDDIWATFLDALAPLHEAGKLGAVLLQFPRWVLPSKVNRDLISDAVSRLGQIRSAVELRNKRWFGRNEADSARTLEWFQQHDIPLVMVDGPQGLESSIPAVTASTSRTLAMVRLHGRRADTWERTGVPTVERYRWFYTTDELAEWIPRITEALRRAGEVHVLLNNCYGNYGAANALELGSMLESALGVAHGTSNARHLANQERIMSERNAGDSEERIEEKPSRSADETANNPPADSKNASKSIPRGTDEETPRADRVKESDEPR
jgi:uncharacterized protein YecE (DUF72 family)